MFSVGFSELILILIIAYIFVGPKDLPKVARWFGNVIKRTRDFVREIKKESGWEDVMNEAKELQNTVRESTDTVQSASRNVTEEFSSIDAKVNETIAEVNKTINEIKQSAFRR